MASTEYHKNKSMDLVETSYGQPSLQQQKVAIKMDLLLYRILNE